MNDSEEWQMLYEVGVLSSGLHQLQSRKTDRELLEEINRRVWDLLRSHPDKFTAATRPLNGILDGPIAI